MNGLLIGFIIVLNFALSWWNAYATGKAWAEAKHAGGWPRFMTWMGAIMSASGFTWVYLILAAFGLGAAGVLPEEYVKYALELGYVIIIPGILFSGLMITVDSWARAYRNGGVLNYGVAAWNTYAQVHNTYSAISGFGQAIGDLGEGLFGGKNRRSSSKDEGQAILALIVILLVIAAIIAGTVTTVLIIKKTAASTPLLSEEEMRRNLAAKAAR